MTFFCFANGDAEGNHVDNPYAEGLVVKVGNGERFDVDAHYEARVLTFSKASIQALRNFNNSGYILSINTPFGKTKQTINVRNDGVYAMDGTLICTIEQINNINDASNSEIKKMLFEDDADFQWMKFVRNTTSNPSMPSEPPLLCGRYSITLTSWCTSWPTKYVSSTGSRSSGRRRTASTGLLLSNKLPVHIRSFRSQPFRLRLFLPICPPDC